MRVKDIRPIDRPQEKLIRYGVEKLTLSELLAIIIGSGTKNLNVIDLSKKITQEFQDKKLQSITFSDLQLFRGIGKTKACRVIAAIELGRRIISGKKTSFIMKPQDVWNELVDIRASKKEHFVVFYLDIRNQIIEREIVSIGTVNASLVHPRELFEPAIRHLATQILISHNHPSGDCNPSDEDLILTKRLIEAGKILGIEIIDHVIVTATKFFSFKEHKLIKD